MAAPVFVCCEMALAQNHMEILRQAFFCCGSVLIFVVMRLVVGARGDERFQVPANSIYFPANSIYFPGE